MFPRGFAAEWSEADIWHPQKAGNVTEAVGIIVWLH